MTGEHSFSTKKFDKNEFATNFSFQFRISPYSNFSEKSSALFAAEAAAAEAGRIV